MSSPRVAFANSTNSPRSSSRPTSTRFPSKPSSRKSAPTCTVSLASVSANDSCANLASISSSPSSSTFTNLIPFPSSPVECSDSAISQPDRTCLLLLRSSTEILSQPRARASPVRPVAQDRRKRSTACLLQPVTAVMPGQCSSVESLCQPPRKRPRLQGAVKTPKRTSPINSSDLRFLAMVQRSIAGDVIKRGAVGRLKLEPCSESMDLEAQDKLLASRLRSQLLAHGLKGADLIDVGSEPRCDTMDVDLEPDTSPVVSVDMDIDVDSTARHPSSPSTSILSSPPRPPVLLGTGCLSAQQLVAALIIRHQIRKRNNSATAGSREKGIPGKIVRRPSPLADSHS